MFTEHRAGLDNFQTLTCVGGGTRGELGGEGAAGEGVGMVPPCCRIISCWVSSVTRMNADGYRIRAPPGGGKENFLIFSIR